ncbi:class IV adenylate cyclase [Shewanella corallii]|uniref:Class IV adenylate cyclase n=1 Tax=Shewanella corallii TaxID=560080 RepID=A0ABT0NBG5_9GAMM|nr:class IV adenylate cyclase [Shewanella corallii]MCL2915455.1 class IV adenylate cyclase [Shewanella corallii]
MNTEHFKGSFEVELKYRLDDKKTFLEYLNQQAFEVMFEDNLELDTFYDTADRQLAYEGKLLCIRELQPSGVMIWFLKGPEPERCESTNINDAGAAKAMLLSMGYSEVARSTKHRSVYFVDKFHITLDRLDNIGWFAEFAVMTDDETLAPAMTSELQCLAARFGLTEQHREYQSYRELMGVEFS